MISYTDGTSSDIYSDTSDTGTTSTFDRDATYEQIYLDSELGISVTYYNFPGCPPVKPINENLIAAQQVLGRYRSKRITKQRYIKPCFVRKMMRCNRFDLRVE